MQSKCDIVYLAKGRPEFTSASLAALAVNTNWERVRSFRSYTDGDTKSHESWGEDLPDLAFIDMNPFGGPVAIMNDYLVSDPAPLWCKIDNDVIVPPGWLDAALEVMDAHPELDLLGIEPPESRTPAPWAHGKRVPYPENDWTTWGKHPNLKTGELFSTFATCDSIGGVGLFRTRAWQSRPPMVPHSVYGGFGDWAKRTKCACGWIVPPIKLFLLDRIVTREPWGTLNKQYLESGAQRAWTPYSDEVVESLAGWWLK